MGNDLPDFQSQVVSAAVEATSFRSGFDADKPASPAAGDIWLARDTGYLYVCFTAGSWEKVAKLYLLLAGGTMSGAIAMGAQKITGMADPTAAQDAATKAYADVIDAKLDDVTRAEPARALDTIYQNSSKIRFITISLAVAAGENAVFYLGATSPPTTEIGDAYVTGAAGTSARQHFSFIVPPNYYYKATIAAGTPVIDEWHEWDLF